MTKQKQVFRNVCKFITNKKLKYHIYIGIQTLHSVLCWSTFGSDYSLELYWVWRYKPGTPVFGEFLPFFSADLLKLCKVGWGGTLHSFFQVSPEMFDQVQDRALAGPLKNIQRLVPKPLFGSVLRVVGLLDGEPSPMSEILSALEQVSILVSSDQRILFLMVFESLGAFWQTLSRLSCAFYRGVAYIWPLYHKGLIGGVLHRPSGRFSHLHRGTLELCQSDHRVLVHLPDQAWSFSPDCSVWPGGQL